jgi:CBS domain containing-hemolysin-like protein
VDFVGWAIVLICLLAGGTLFFSVNAIALRTFSHGKLQEAFKAASKKNHSKDQIERLVENAEELILTCSLYRLIFNMCILLLLVAIFSGSGESQRQMNPTICYLLTFIIAIVLFSIFSLAIPHA